MKWKQLWEKMKPVLKKRWWHIFLLIISSIYVFIYRYDIYQMTELNAQNLIFILWLILLGLPLFSEIEIGSVKLKKEIEQTRAEVKESIGELKYQILEMKVNNTNSNMLVFSNQPLKTSCRNYSSTSNTTIRFDPPTILTSRFLKIIYIYSKLDCLSKSSCRHYAIFSIMESGGQFLRWHNSLFSMRYLTVRQQNLSVR